MKYVCTAADIVAEQGKNPYVQVTFEANVGNIFLQSTMNKVRMAMSGGNFTADNKPDYAKNLAWCQANAPKMVGVDVEIERIPVQTEPYYTIVNNTLQKGEDGKPLIRTEIGVNSLMYLDEATGEYRPAMSETQLKRQAARMLNSFGNIITVSKYEERKKAKEIAKNSANLIAEVKQEEANPFSPQNGVVDDLPM